VWRRPRPTPGAALWQQGEGDSDPVRSWPTVSTRRRAREHLKEQDAARPPVHAGAVALAADHLGRHVLWGAADGVAAARDDLRRSRAAAGEAWRQGGREALGWQSRDGRNASSREGIRWLSQCGQVAGTVTTRPFGRARSNRAAGIVVRARTFGRVPCLWADSLPLGRQPPNLHAGTLGRHSPCTFGRTWAARPPLRSQSRRA